MWKREPLPTSLSTLMRPPISSTRRRLIASPRPVPPNSRVVEPSAWEKCSKIFCWASGEMPTPVSSTLIRTRICAPSGSAWARTTTSPWRVNLMALCSRLAITWRSRKGSPCMRSAVAGGLTWLASSRPFSAAGWANMATLSSTSSPSSKSMRSSSMWPASIFEKSRMSLMMPSRWRPDCWTSPA